METQEKKEGLMYEGGAIKPTQSKILRIALGLFLSLIIVVSVLFIFSVVKKNKQVSRSGEDVSKQVVYQEAVKSAKKLVNLYANEGVPVLPIGTKDQNFGLANDSKNIAVQGKFLLSGKKTESAAGTYIQSYALQLGNKDVKPTLLFPKLQISAMTEFFDKNLTKAFVLSATEQSVRTDPDHLSIFDVDLKTGEIKLLESTKSSGERNFAWSAEAKLLAFNRLKTQEQNTPYIDLLPLENWEIVIVNPGTDEVVSIIKDAFQPKWLGGGSKLLFLKKDGLYIFDIGTKELKKLVAVEPGKNVISTSMIDLSKDGSHIIWTVPASGIITVYKVSKDTSVIEELGRIQQNGTEFYWPIFSPNGKQYAVQAIDSLKGQDLYRKNPRIEVRETEGRAIIFSSPLDEFDFNQLFSDGWVD